MNKENWANFMFKDVLEAKVFDKYGDLKQFHIDKDLITSAGKAAVANMLISGTTDISGFAYIVIGSGDTAASTGDTAAEKELVRAAASLSRITTGATNDTTQLVYTFSSGNPSGLGGTSTGSQAIQESVVINEATGGTALCRQTFSDLSLDWDGGDSLQITWKIQIS